MREGTRSLVDCHLCPGRTDPDVTWRFDGAARNAAAVSPGDMAIATNTETVEAPTASLDVRSLRMATSPLNFADLFLAVGESLGTGDGQVRLYHIDP